MIKPVIETIDVTKIYNQGKPNEVTAVEEVSLRIDKRSLVVLQGPSGSGKTTLLSLIGCQAKPTKGEVIVQGKKVSKLPEKFMNRHKRTHIGFIFQHFQLIPDLSVLDNIELPLLPAGIAPRERHSRADRLLEQLDLGHRRQFKAGNLSGGEQQRVAIARALINDAGILLADEPTAHLDSKLTAEFLAYMKHLKKSGCTILITSHDPLIYRNPIVDEAFQIKDGKVVA